MIFLFSSICKLAFYIVLDRFTAVSIIWYWHLDPVTERKPFVQRKDFIFLLYIIQIRGKDILTNCY